MDQRVDAWLARDPDPTTREELSELVASGNASEIERRFAGRLEFGTAGLRGLLGAGPMRMNRLVVRETTAGLAAYLLDTSSEAMSRGVVIGFDGRRGSAEFAQDAACVLAGRGVKVFLGDQVLPTPVCAFGVTHLGAAAGVVVTASHNPPQYNGYKVYWEHGSQIIRPQDSGIAAAIHSAAARELPWLELSAAKKQGLVTTIGDALIEAYLEAIRELSIHDPNPARADLKIAYTPLHGVGAAVAETALSRAGFPQVHTVPSQRQPDGRFPTVSFPNPEEPGAMDQVLRLAEEVDADLAVANDPDADRLAVAVRMPKGGYEMLTGDQVGALLGADFMRASPAGATFATTVVSSRMLNAMAKKARVYFFETLTGFKWICAEARKREATGLKFSYGYEEALGYTLGTVVRDKDGISALVAIAELAAELRQKDLNLWDELERLYREHGLHVTARASIALAKGETGPSPGDRLRITPPELICGRRVLGAGDVHEGMMRYVDGRDEELDLPPADVLIYELEGNVRIVVRPSGTEPKIKCYYELVVPVPDEANIRDVEAAAQAELGDLVAAHQIELRSLETA